MALITLLYGLVTGQHAAAVDYFWDVDGDGTINTGGTGTWDTTSSFWRTGSDVGTLTTWPNTTPGAFTNTAVLSGLAGTVTMGTAINLHTLRFGVSGYVIGSAVNTNRLIFGGTDPTIDTGAFDADITARISNSGSPGLIKTGSGTLSLSNSNNDWGGGFFINEGTVLLTNSGNALGGGGVTVATGARLLLNNVNTNGSSAGLLTLQNGATLEGQGSLAAWGTNPGMSIAANATVTLHAATVSDTLSISNGAEVKDGSSSSVINVTGAGTVVLATANTTNISYAGSWNLNGPILRITAATALGDAGALNVLRPITLTAGTLDLRDNSGASFTSAATVVGDVTISPARNGSGSSVTQNIGTLTIGSNLLTIAHGANFTANNTGSISTDATTLTGNPTFNLTNTNGTAVGTTSLGALNGGGSARTITKNGAGTLVFSAAAASLTSGTQLTVTAGIAQINHATALGSAVTTVNANGGTFRLNGNSTNLGGLNGTSGGIVENANATPVTLTVTNSAANQFAGVLQNGTGGGALALTKAGGETLTLSGPNTYTGATTVSAGILNIQHNTGLGTTATGTSVSNGATLQLQGNITVGAEALSLNGGAAAGQTGALVNVSGTNTYGGAITVAASSSISALTGSVLNLTGGVVKNGTTATFTGGGTINVSGVGITGAAANSDLVVDGATLNVTVDNPYNGPTSIINNGTLNIGTGGSLSATTGVTVNTGGTLLLSGTNNNKINNAANVTLGVGTITLGGSASLDETVGTLTLTGNSIIDFGSFAGGHTLRFADSSSINWGSFTLSVYNWTENADHLFFGSTFGQGLTTAQLNAISFWSDGGSTFLGTGMYGPAAGEVSPVPEPSAVLVGLSLLAMAGYRERRWVLRCKAARLMRQHAEC